MPGGNGKDHESTPTAVVITSKPDLFTPLVVDAGFDVVGLSDTAVYGERLAEHHRPDVMVIEHVLTGEQGWEALPHLRAASPDSMLLLVVAEDWTPSDPTAIGGLAVTSITNLQRLLADGVDVRGWIRDQIAAGFVDRRSGKDRRDRQDWSAVGYEKRDRPDRRKSPG
jgi:CheY-like chemotaxis protein